MKTLEQQKQELALYLNEQAIKNREERKFGAIFRDIQDIPCDCNTCQYAKECEIDNPDFDANACKLNS